MFTSQLHDKALCTENQPAMLISAQIGAGKRCAHSRTSAGGLVERRQSVNETGNSVRRGAQLGHVPECAPVPRTARASQNRGRAVNDAPLAATVQADFSNCPAVP